MDRWRRPLNRSCKSSSRVRLFLRQEWQALDAVCLRLGRPVDIPSVAEPFFFDLGADIEATPVMNADDLRKGLQKMMK